MRKAKSCKLHMRFAFLFYRRKLNKSKTSETIVFSTQEHLVFNFAETLLLMRKILFLLLLLCSATGSFGQQIFPTFSKEKQDDAEYHIQLNEAVIVAPQVFANDTDRYHYNQLKLYIKTVMPYVLASVKLFNEINSATGGMNKRNRRKYIRSREKEIKENFEDKLKALNITQGRLLVKLINRQLKVNCYDVVKELKNPVTAAYYQTWARLNGINLNEDYQADKNRDIERVMRSLGY